MKTQPNSNPAPRSVPEPSIGWSIRPANMSDLPRLEQLLAEADLPVEGVGDQIDKSYIVVEDAGRVIASVGLEIYGRYGLLRSLVVAPKSRDQGIGQWLVENRLRWAKSRDIISLFLITFEPEYFARFGYQPVKRDSVPPEIRQSSEFSTICPETATVMALPVDYSDEDLREGVRDRYASIAKSAKKKTDENASCCGPTRCGPSENTISANLYSADELTEVPGEAALISLGCGNPTALAELKPGEVVLDLGSGGGIDVLLSARRVGPSGKAYGLDMTDEMLEIARQNQKKAGVENVEFLKGEIEAIPLPDASVDVIISNCVINLSADKRRVLEEALRVLRPGGRFAVSDIVSRGPVPDSIRGDMELWTGCIAGSLEDAEYRRLLAEVGFADIDVEPTRIYTSADVCCESPADAQQPPAVADGMFMSAFIRGTKPKTH